MALLSCGFVYVCVFEVAALLSCVIVGVWICECVVVWM